MVFKRKTNIKVDVDCWHLVLPALLVSTEKQHATKRKHDQLIMNTYSLLQELTLIGITDQGLCL